MLQVDINICFRHVHIFFFLKLLGLFIAEFNHHLELFKSQYFQRILHSIEELLVHISIEAGSKHLF